MTGNGSGSSPPERDTAGSSEKGWQDKVTTRDVVMVVSAVALTLTVTAFFYNQLDKVAEKVGEKIEKVEKAVESNAKGLAVVSTEITGLRHDIERVEQDVLRVEKKVEAKSAHLMP